FINCSFWQEENRGVMLPSSQEKKSPNASPKTQQKTRKRRRKGEAASTNVTLPEQNIRHNKQRKGRRKGRAKGKAKGKGRHRNKYKSKDPSSQHSHIRRNLEKEVLVQNRTLELLGGGGARILWTNRAINSTLSTKNEISINSNSTISVNIVSSNKNLSTHGTLVGLLIKNTSSSNSSDERTSLVKVSNSSRTISSKGNSTKSLEDNLNATSRRNSYPLKFGRSGEIVVADYQYDYDTIEPPEIIGSTVWFNSEQSRGAAEDGSGLDAGPLQAALGTTLARVLGVLTDQGGSNASHKEQDDEDPCERWMRCKDKLKKAFLGPLGTLPSCPCHYPSAIFYDDKIWDQSQGKYFRWRDVSGEVERLDVYKPGAAYCIRSLLAQGSTSLAAQHCCYDRYRRLLTRGSGAGTPDFVSPEVSASLHEKVDVLPWKLCKGDFTRYNSVRPPNNENNCTENPSNEEYQQQIQLAQYF
ncbi:hypothetical protein L9F63_002880, partial [Diploptera punctata]